MGIPDPIRLNLYASILQLAIEARKSSSACQGDQFLQLFQMRTRVRVLFRHPGFQLLYGLTTVDDIRSLIHALSEISGIIGDTEQRRGIKAYDLSPRALINA